ncbi:hypothetical protein ACOMHN_033127 [Nucella lapillus]
MKSWQVVAGLLLTWVVLMLYMSSSLMGSAGEGSSRVERQLHRALEELDQLHSQNLELQTLASELSWEHGMGSVGNMGWGQWGTWDGVSGEHGMGSLGNMGQGHWGTWDGVSGEHGMGSVGNMGWGQWGTWDGVTWEHGTGSVGNMGRGQWGTWYGVSGEHGMGSVGNMGRGQLGTWDGVSGIHGMGSVGNMGWGQLGTWDGVSGEHGMGSVGNMGWGQLGTFDGVSGEHGTGELQGTGDQRQIIEKLQSRLQKASQDVERLSSNHLLGKTAGPVQLNPAAPKKLSVGKEQARRKVENTASELWYYINSRLKELDKASEGGAINSVVKSMQVDLKGYQTVMVEDFLKLRQADGDEDWRLKESLALGSLVQRRLHYLQESLALGSLVQRRLHYLQNPKDCRQSKVVLCDLQKGCGFGCQLHHVTYCLIVAYATQRTLVLDSRGWRYASRGWDSVFKPLSDTCTDASGPSVHWAASQTRLEAARVLKLPIVDSLYPRPDFMPLAIPADLAPRLSAFHGDPAVWWIGQMVRYLMRPNWALQEEMDAAAHRMQFKRPIVGVHIRRTDKVGVEAAFHGLDEYMGHVDAYFSQLEHRQPAGQRRVYLATDDPSVLADAKRKYSRYEFISDNGISRSAALGSRYTDSSLRGVIMDIHFLSLSDYLVCTFSSQVCRVAYELMQTMHGDASASFRSLDDVFYYGGQNAHNLRAAEAHQPRSSEELRFESGDLLGIAGNHWNGYSKGTLRKTGKSGLYPSYKVQNEIVSVQMPVYPQVKEEEEEEGEGERKKKEEERKVEVGVAVDYGHR